jgi:hypothetical protein
MQPAGNHEYQPAGKAIRETLLPQRPRRHDPPYAEIERDLA